MTIHTEKPQRRRGAPLGNSNAMRHGFCSRQFKRIVANSAFPPNLKLD